MARRLLLCHATGFCKDVWAPLIDELAAIAGTSLVCDAINFSGHGGRAAPDAPLTSWDPFRDDVLEAAGSETGLIGVGHSMGGAALVAAELARPGTFAKLVLFEPIIFPRAADGAGEVLASMAERRRNEWSSATDARKHLEGRGAFKAWERRALDAYLAGALAAGASAVTLACVPTFEGSIYRSRPRGLWERLGELSCEVVIASGANSRHADGVPGLETTAALYEAMAKEARARVRLPDVGRFAPMEAPAAYARRVGGVRGEESALGHFDQVDCRENQRPHAGLSRDATVHSMPASSHLSPRDLRDEIRAGTSMALVLIPLAAASALRTPTAHPCSIPKCPSNLSGKPRVLTVTSNLAKQDATRAAVTMSGGDDAPSPYTELL